MIALHIASLFCHLEVVEVLLAYGANVNDKNMVSTMYNIITEYNDILCMIITVII